MEEITIELIISRLLFSFILVGVGILILWWTRKKHSYQYFTNTWLWGIFPLPALPSYGIIAVFMGGVGILLNVVYLVGSLFGLK